MSPVINKTQFSGRPNDLLMTQMEIILSTPVIEGAVRDLEAQGKIDFSATDDAGSSGPRSWIRKLTGQSNPVPLTADDRRDLYVARLQDNISVTSSGGNAVLLVTVPGGSPTRVARVANAVAESYLRGVLPSAASEVAWKKDKSSTRRRPAKRS